MAVVALGGMGLACGPMLSGGGRSMLAFAARGRSGSLLMFARFRLG
jgi:hypothetical protein